MSALRYVCQGTCKAKLTPEEYKAGKTTCGDPKCDHYGKPLVRREYCSSCNTVFEEGEDHFCV